MVRRLDCARLSSTSVAARHTRIRDCQPGVSALQSSRRSRVRMTSSLPLPLRKRLLTALLVMIVLLTSCSPDTPGSQESTSSPPPVLDRGVASISFDDGTIGQYTYARPVLRKNNLPGTYYLVSDAL